jgi:LysR family transcriptional regulator (chromosome initiation inhibitor)
MLDLAQLEALTAAVAEGTFEGAARRLHVTPSAISQRIKALETSVGRVLLTRTRPIQTTSSGQALLRAARQIEAIAAEALEELGDDAARQPAVIALAANADSLATWLMPALAAVDPPLSFDVRRSDETLTTELLRAGEVTAAVTASAQPVPGCVVESLGSMRYRPRASPAFAARWFAGGPTGDALARAPMVCFDRTDQTQDAYLRRRTRRRLHPPRHYVPGSEAFVQAVALGLGWGMVPDLQAEAYDLVVFDPGRHFDVRLYWQQWRLRSASLDRLAEAVRRQAAAALPGR